MQSHKGKPRTERKENSAKNANGRVVSLQAWRTKKRIAKVRGRRSWKGYALTLVNYVLMVLAGVFAIISCIPSTLQIPAVLYTWFFATLGGAVGLFLYVLRERLAMRFLSIYALSMLISFVAALVRLQTM